jgi:Lsr2
MAQKVEVTLIDDLDGGTADTVVRFGLDGKAYEIDLSTANAEKFRTALARYVEAARKNGPVRGAGRGTRAKATDAGPNTAEVREWAKSQGIEVSDRGRLSKDLVVQFQEASV